MTTRPTDVLDIATDTNYTSGPHVGTPTKVAFDSQDVDEGNIAGATFAPDARKFNWWQNLASVWVRWLQELTDANVLFFTVDADTDTSSDQGAGKITFDSANPATVTEIQLDDVSALGTSVSAMLLAAGAGKLLISKDGSNFQQYSFSGVSDGPGTSVLFTITSTDEAQGSFSAGDVVMVRIDETSAVALASTTEVLTGTDTAKAVTPDALAALWEQGADVTDGATINLGEGGSFNLITSTTTITAFAFTTSKVGRTALVRFNTVRTLTHNATSLILQGSANITTAVGDYAIVIDKGSGNVALLYFRADGTAVVGSTPSSETTAHEVQLSFFDDPTYGYSLFGSLSVSFLPDNCVVMAKATFAWGSTTGDTDDIVDDGAAVLYLALTMNAGNLVLVRYRNDSDVTALEQFHAISNELFDYGNPTNGGSVDAYIDTGNLVLSVTFPGVDAYSGQTRDGIAHLHVESIFERSELPAP